MKSGYFKPSVLSVHLFYQWKTVLSKSHLIWIFNADPIRLDIKQGAILLTHWIQRDVTSLCSISTIKVKSQQQPTQNQFC